MDNINFKEIFDKAIKDLGKVNILIAGKTGVGKSTLLNAVFGEDLAATGVGKPITQITKEYTKEGMLFHLFDTKGFEMDEYQTISEDVINLINNRRTADPKEHIHLAWYCISSLGGRIEDSEIQFVNKISQQIPVIVVLTQSVGNNALEFRTQVEYIFFSTNVTVIDVLALPYKIDADYTKKSYNVDTLVKVTYEHLPDAAKAAFAASQKVERSIREKTIKKIIALAATSAGAVAATPIPFSDAIALAPIQIGMLASISKAMGMSVNEAFLKTLVASTAGVVGASFIGRTIVSSLLKLIPGAGSVVGGAISAATASSLTVIMGDAYYKAIDKLMSENIAMTADNVSASFIGFLKKSKEK